MAANMVDQTNLHPGARRATSKCDTETVYLDRDEMLRVFGKVNTEWVYDTA